MTTLPSAPLTSGWLNFLCNHFIFRYQFLPPSFFPKPYIPTVSGIEKLNEVPDTLKFLCNLFTFFAENNDVDHLIYILTILTDKGRILEINSFLTAREIKQYSSFLPSWSHPCSKLEQQKFVKFGSLTNSRQRSSGDVIMNGECEKFFSALII